MSRIDADSPIETLVANLRDLLLGVPVPPLISRAIETMLLAVLSEAGRLVPLSAHVLERKANRSRITQLRNEVARLRRELATAQQPSEADTSSASTSPLTVTQKIQ